MLRPSVDLVSDLPRRTFLRTAAGLALAATAGCAKEQPTTQRPTSSPTGAALAPEPPASTSPVTSSPVPTVAGGPAGPAVEIGTGPTGTSQVALTFHGNGDPSLALALLDAAEAAAARITVFAVGTWLADPATRPVLERLAAGGHELGNHTYTHPALRRLGPAATLAEITRCRDALAQVAGTPGRFFRPSGTPTADATILAAAGQAGYRTSLAYDLDPEDYRDPGAALVRSRVLATVRAGSVVSLHLGHRGTVDALPGVLDGLAQRGLTAVTASTLLPV